MKSKLFYISIIFLIALNLKSQSNTEQIKKDSIFYINYDPVKDLINDIDNFINIPELFNANIGVSLYSISKNQYLYNYNQNKNFTPASLVKLFTTYMGLSYLNNDFRPSTEIYTNGVVNRKGMLMGDLVIRSNGNLSITNQNYETIFGDWITSLDSAGISSISGNLVIDESFFDNIYYPIGWAIDDIKYNYSSQISAVNFNNNLVDISIYSDGEKGEKAQIILKPNCNYVSIDNKVMIKGDNSESNIIFDRDFTSNNISLKGTIKQDEYKDKSYFLSSTIHNPSLYFAAVFKDFLIKNKISFNGEIIVHSYLDNVLDYNQMNLMAMNEGNDIVQIIKEINSESDNLLAEILLKQIAKEKSGVGSTENGLEQIKKLAEDIGIPSSGMKLFDGSGLSRMDLLSPIAIIRLLNYIAAQKDYNLFLNSLARPNEKGTLKHRFKNTNAEKKVWAKTGSMNFVNNIAGYLKTKDGELVSFVICFNNFTTPSSTVRNIQDLIIMRLAAFERKVKKD
jgi:PBP4 family serine-type D-alanyl-D-alanine carboxypeptidase